MLLHSRQRKQQSLRREGRLRRTYWLTCIDWNILIETWWLRNMMIEIHWLTYRLWNRTHGRCFLPWVLCYEEHSMSCSAQTSPFDVQLDDYTIVEPDVMVFCRDSLQVFADGACESACSALFRQGYSGMYGKNIKQYCMYFICMLLSCLAYKGLL